MVECCGNMRRHPVSVVWYTLGGRNAPEDVRLLAIWIQDNGEPIVAESVKDAVTGTWATSGYLGQEFEGARVVAWAFMPRVPVILSQEQCNDQG